MEEIFQWADPVFVWLGRATDESNHAFEYLRYLAVDGVDRRSIQALPWILKPKSSDRITQKLRYVWRHKFVDESIR
jgi:hypothetical protein